MATYIVSAGQTSSGTALHNGDIQQVYGTAVDTRVHRGGREEVFAGGTAVGTRAEGGAESSGEGEVLVHAGGTASGTVADYGGHVRVEGGETVGTVLHRGGLEEVLAGGVADGTVVGTATSVGGDQVVRAGGIASRAVVGPGGRQHVQDGGTASGTTLSGGIGFDDLGKQYVQDGGRVLGTVVNDGGLEVVRAGGTAVNTVVRDVGKVIDDGTLAFIPGDGAIREAGTIAGRGALVLAGSGTTVALTSANLYAGGTELANGTLDLAAPGAAGTGSITFLGGAKATPTLQIEPGDAPDNIVSGFLPGAIIDLAGIGLATSATLGANNLLTISGGSFGPVALHFDPGQSYAGYAFRLAADGHGGTEVTVVPASPSTATSA